MSQCNETFNANSTQFEDFEVPLNEEDFRNMEEFEMMFGGDSDSEEPMTTVEDELSAIEALEEMEKEIERTFDHTVTAESWCWDIHGNPIPNPFTKRIVKDQLKTVTSTDGSRQRSRVGSRQ